MRISTRILCHDLSLCLMMEQQCRFLVFMTFADHRIVASFDVGKPVSFMEDNLLQLDNDITDEISFPMTKVTKHPYLTCMNFIVSIVDHSVTSVSFLEPGCGISA